MASGYRGEGLLGCRHGKREEKKKLYFFFFFFFSFLSLLSVLEWRISVLRQTLLSFFLLEPLGCPTDWMCWSFCEDTTLYANAVE